MKTKMSNGISPFYLVFLLQRKIIFLFGPEGEEFLWSTEEKDFKCLVLLSRFFFGHSRISSFYLSLDSIQINPGHFPRDNMVINKKKNKLYGPEPFFYVE